MSSWPNYDSIVQSNYETFDGFHSLGMIKKHRPDIQLISLQGHTIQDKNFDWLEIMIDQALESGKKAAIIVWDEDWMWPHNQQLYDLLNSYEHDPVWWITQTNRLEEWHHYRGLKIKVLEVQWWPLNDCLSYRELYQPTVHSADSAHNYLCMLGRYEPHKYELGKKLYSAGLSKKGLTTVAYPDQYPQDHQEWSTVNPIKLYPSVSRSGYGKTRANSKKANTWVSANVENFLSLETQFKDIPLMINPDSGFGLFFLTEKLVWPPLLGKLFLIYGRPHIMQMIQRFWDVDISSYANLEFDSILDNQDRLDSMVDTNRDLIKDCQDIWRKLQPELEQARWTIGQNFYNFAIRQLDLIH